MLYNLNHKTYLNFVTGQRIDHKSARRYLFQQIQKRKGCGVLSAKNTAAVTMRPPTTRNRVWKRIKKNAGLYILFAPVLIYYLVFHYYPMLGLQIAFKNFLPTDGIWGSEWIGFEHFQMFFSSPDFWRLLYNTLSISILQLVFGFPVPVILAIIINEVRGKRFRKLVQTVTYAPHFISVVVLAGMLVTFLSPSSGIINFIIQALGGQPVDFLGKAEWFKPIYVLSGIWQTSGYSAIVFIASLTSIDTSLYEAAAIDGCGRIKRLLNVDIPAILPTVVTMFILNVGKIMNVGYQKILLLQNSLNTSASDVIQTYVYRMGLANGLFDFATAVGLFNNIINLILLLLVNKISRQVAETSLW